MKKMFKKPYNGPKKFDSLNIPSDMMNQFANLRNEMSGPAKSKDRTRPSPLCEKRPSFPVFPVESLSFASMRPSGNLSSGQSRSVQTDRKIDPISSDKKVDNPATGIEMVNKFFASFRTEMKKNTQDRHAIPLTHVAPDNAETRLPMNRPQTSFGSPVQAKLPRYESRMDVRNHSPDTTADTMIAGTVQAREADARRWMTSQKAVEDNTKRTAASAARTVELLEQIKAKDFFQIETG